MARERKKDRGARPAGDGHAPLPAIRKEHLVLLAIFLFAIFVRVNWDPGMPYHYDPGKNIVYARAAVDSFPFIPQYNPYFNLGEYYEYQVLFPYAVSFLHVLTGFSLVSLTAWLAILAGAALCLTVYILSLEIFRDTTAALVSAFVIAASRIELLAYMNYYPQILAMTLMPLGFLFLIRYVNNRNRWDFLAAAVLSALVILASYIAGFVYFLIVIVALAAWAAKDKKTLPALLLLPLVTALLLAFFWLPIAWRNGSTMFVTKSSTTLLGATSTGFTNVPWSFLSYLENSGITVITILMGLAALYLVRKISWDFGKVLLAVWILIAFLLMESYLVRPILWVDRYAQFLDIGILLVTGILFSLFITLLNRRKGPAAPYTGFILLLLLAVPLWSAVHVDIVYGTWGYPSDMASLESMKALPEGSLVVAPPSVQSFWVSALSGAHVLGGETAQIMRIRYRGDGDSNTILNSPDVEKKMDLIRKYGVNYIWIPYHESGLLVWNPDLKKEGIDAFNDTRYFAVVNYFPDQYGSTVLLRVKENLTPRYNPRETNSGITVLGYAISFLTLAGCAWLCSGRRFPGLPVRDGQG